MTSTNGRPSSVDLQTLELSSIEPFWTAPMDDRYAAFAALRRHDPIRFFEEQETEYLPAGPGYWAVTRHADVVEASRRSDAFCSGEGTNIPDLPPEFREFFG